MRSLLVAKQMEFEERSNRYTINKFISKMEEDTVSEELKRDKLRDFLLQIFEYDEAMFYFNKCTI